MLDVALIGDRERDLCHHGYGYFYYTALPNNATRQQGLDFLRQIDHWRSRLIQILGCLDETFDADQIPFLIRLDSFFSFLFG